MEITCFQLADGQWVLSGRMVFRLKEPQARVV